MRKPMICPFCGKYCGSPREIGHAYGDLVWTDCVISIECPCGATWATEHGGRAVKADARRD